MRLRYVALAVSTIGLGLGVHLGGDALAPAARDVFGDVLWAAMLMWWVSALVPSRSLRLRAALALAGCFAVEVSQLVRTPALDAVRSSRLGHLVLGSGFDPRDLLAYTGGVLAVVLLDTAWRRSRVFNARSGVPIRQVIRRSASTRTPNPTANNSRPD